MCQLTGGKLHRAVSAKYVRGLLLRDNHVHATTFHVRRLFDLRAVFEERCNPLKQVRAEILSSHLAPAEDHGELHLIAFFEEVAGTVGFHRKVTDFGLRTQPHSLELVRRLLVLFRLLVLLVLVFSEVKNAAHRRTRVGRNFHEVEGKILRHAQRFMRGKNADLVAVLANHTHLAGPNSFVDSGAVTARLFGVMGSSGNCSVLAL